MVLDALSECNSSMASTCRSRSRPTSTPSMATPG